MPRTAPFRELSLSMNLRWRPLTSRVGRQMRSTMATGWSRVEMEVRRWFTAAFWHFILPVPSDAIIIIRWSTRHHKTGHPMWIMLGSKIHLRTFPLNFLRSRGPLFEKGRRAFWNSSQASKFSSFIRKIERIMNDNDWKKSLKCAIRSSILSRTIIEPSWFEFYLFHSDKWQNLTIIAAGKLGSLGLILCFGLISDVVINHPTEPSIFEWRRANFRDLSEISSSSGTVASHCASVEWW
jgi:hypothetical protein